MSEVLEKAVAAINDKMAGATFDSSVKFKIEDPKKKIKEYCLKINKYNDYPNNIFSIIILKLSSEYSLIQ